MIDQLLARARLAIEESHSIREQGRVLMRELVESRQELRLAVFDSAMLRVEINVLRNDRRKPASAPGLL
jgi:hypothetical protein